MLRRESSGDGEGSADIHGYATPRSPYACSGPAFEAEGKHQPAD